MVMVLLEGIFWVKSPKSRVMRTAGGSVGPGFGGMPGIASAISKESKAENGQGSGTYYQYVLTVSNPTETARDSWKIQLAFSCGIELQNGWNGMYEAEGNTLTISSMDYNGAIGEGGSVENVGFIIRAEEGCRLEE